MNIPFVRQATEAELASVVNTLTVAFAADPVNRWYLPDSDRYLKYFPKIAELLAQPALESGTCFVTEHFEGAALWYPPGVGADEEALGGQFMQAAPEYLAEAVGEFMEALAHYHPHDEDCWYLPLMGVDPAHQGKGLGAALMKHATDLIDRQGALSYLESSTPQNISLYERHGFESTGQILFGEAKNIATPMVRDRR